MQEFEFRSLPAANLVKVSENIFQIFEFEGNGVQDYRQTRVQDQSFQNLLPGYENLKFHLPVVLNVSSVMFYRGKMFRNCLFIFKEYSTFDIF